MSEELYKIKDYDLGFVNWLYYQVNKEKVDDAVRKMKDNKVIDDIERIKTYKVIKK